jgi:hypothetical protein
LEVLGANPSNVKGLVATIHFPLPSRTLFEHLVRYLQHTFKPMK